MNQQEFLLELRKHLNGKINRNEVEENITYYAEYIRGEMAKGRSEEEIIGELGDPDLLSRSILDAHEASGDVYEPHFSSGSSYDYGASNASSYGYGDPDATYGYGQTGTGADNASSREEAYGDVFGDMRPTDPFRGSLSTHLRRFGVAAAVILIAVSAIAVVGGLVSFLAPIVFPVLVILFLLRFFSPRN